MNEASRQESPQPSAPAEETTLQKLTPLIAFVIVGIAVALKWPELALQAAAFAVTLGILVFVHELGHYQVARWAGMKVNRFGIGFPPWLFSHRHKGIEYSIGALPIGGMVDIAGLGSEEEMVGTATTGDLPENKRNPNAPHGTKNFQDASLGWRFATLFAGPLMNFLFAVVVAVLLFSVIGGNPKEDSAYQNYIISTQAGKPASAAGLQKGDLIVKVNGKDTSNVKLGQYQKAIADPIQNSGGKPIVLEIKRGSEIIKKSITPEVGFLDDAKTQKKYMLGITFGIDPGRLEYERVSVAQSVKLTWLNAVEMTKRVMTLIGHAVSFRMTPEEKDNIRGVVFIAHTVGTTAKEYDWRQIVQQGIAISMNLGLMNLLPFPALDGGRIMFLGYEFVMRKPFDPRKEGIIHMAGMVLILVFMLFVAFKDVARLLG